MNFNHISKRLTEGQVSALTSLHFTYQKQYWCYKKMFKRHRRLNLALKLSSVILTKTGAVIGTVTLNPMILAGVSGTSVLLQTITTHKIFQKKTEACRYVFQSYQKLLNTLKLCLRSGEIDEYLERELVIVDDQVVDNCPPISEKLEKQHAKLFPAT